MTKNTPKKQSVNKTNQVQLLTQPSLIHTGLFFSIYLESREEYEAFISDVKEKNLHLCQALIQSREIPKYFNLITLDEIYDLKSLLANLVLEIQEDGVQVTNQPYDEENDSLMEMSYGDYLQEKFTHLGLAQDVAHQINQNNHGNNQKPVLLQLHTQPDLVGEHFCLDFNGDNDYALCDFDYHFPQKCVFIAPFMILGNEKPLAKFTEKVEDIDIKDDFQFLLEDLYDNDTIEVLGFDLMENASVYNMELIQADFEYEVDMALQSQKDQILYFDTFPVFIQFSQNQKKQKEAQIRLPFLTFDMFAQNVLLPEDTDMVEPFFHSHVMRRLMVSDVLANLGLDYNYVVGQRIDFVHEPEMQASVINKVMQRAAIEGNVYYEESTHHIEGDMDNAKLATLAQVHIPDYPFMVMTIQDDDSIVKQVNAYPIEVDYMEEAIEDIGEYFSTFGNQELEHIVIEGHHHMHYCEEHLKVNGLVI
jgi:hypothetical protein